MKYYPKQCNGMGQLLFDTIKMMTATAVMLFYIKILYYFFSSNVCQYVNLQNLEYINFIMLKY